MPKNNNDNKQASNSGGFKNHKENDNSTQSQQLTNVYDDGCNKLAVVKGDFIDVWNVHNGFTQSHFQPCPSGERISCIAWGLVNIYFFLL